MIVPFASQYSSILPTWLCAWLVPNVSSLPLCTCASASRHRPESVVMRRTPHWKPVTGRHDSMPQRLECLPE
ncbi:hypothetical protein BDR05DRAFT_962898 [Suillus weaverae]|nr:hypothetical protein BDR05DRAFT_962898 [Suillus weaverae]